MKKITTVILLGLIMSLQLGAQEKNNDKSPDKWAEENKEMIQKMSWHDWLKLDKEYRKPASMQFKPEQRYTFWLQKMEDTMTLDWNEKELAHLQKMYDKIKNNPVWFTDETDEGRKKTQDELSIFFKEWAEYAEKEFGWNKNLLFALIADGGKLMDKEGTLDVMASSCTVDSCPATN